MAPWTVAHHAPLSMGFPRQEHWSELPFPSPGDHPNPDIESRLLHCRWIVYHRATWEAPFEFIEIENKVVIAMVGRRGNRELVFHGYRVSAGKDKKNSEVVR